MNPILAAILSFIIPGLGQAIEGDVKKGVIFLIIFIALYVVGMLIFRGWVVSIIRIIFRIYAAYDAYMMAQ
ncbi:MAG: hypothetical protein IJH63_02325 [Methanobrevibacter sp.]|uniref:DUF6677 domain-containing protein n=1 Tax=Methanobrevibacter millerae TaxID=230361 RepID=A0A8T3VHB7_9EURY|nr:DUF6677 family protein [Methanobrevibacter millerae]MBQ6143128.1 hypothetical protein [Clostridia bacterium]MBQ6345349.1 hypothetical protein [Methanobrevibacter sp.]MBE6504723.1 hypothetical protein [Methanobrevibacter millerae]MBR0059106.1 hypothetical protein [Methanobrevibacter sp.]MBR0369544.1 hypothetical protein [Methanobrevibacter sp.]